jgi:hypothetical protein
MPHTCRTCKRTFPTPLELELHLDRCSADLLFCAKCGERFPERHATTDGWHYVCANADCDGEGIGEDLYPLQDVVAPRA